MHHGYVFQDYVLFSDLTVMENVAIPESIQGRPLDECYAAATRVLKKGITGATHRPHQEVYNHTLHMTG
jgi:ABC-type lipoprotein export system ATPase subunit